MGYLSDFEMIEGSKSNYIYNFKIRYYDKVFRNSDIYGVYLITNSLPEYIKEIKMNELGSPFGIIISDKIIKEEKIDNIKYILRLKNSLIIFVVIIVDFIILFDFIKASNDGYKDPKSSNLGANIISSFNPTYFDLSLLYKYKS